jgi:hypothetical protein
VNHGCNHDAILTFKVSDKSSTGVVLCSLFGFHRLWVDCFQDARRGTEVRLAGGPETNCPQKHQRYQHESLSPVNDGLPSRQCEIVSHHHCNYYAGSNRGMGETRDTIRDEAARPSKGRPRTRSQASILNFESVISSCKILVLCGHLGHWVIL